MGSEFFRFLESIVALIVGVAIVALIVSPKAKTSSVIQAAASGLGNSLAVAEAPVTGASTPITLAYPSDNPWGGSAFIG